MFSELSISPRKEVSFLCKFDITLNIISNLKPKCPQSIYHSILLIYNCLQRLSTRSFYNG